MTEQGEIIDIAALEAELDRLPGVRSARLLVDRTGRPARVEVEAAAGAIRPRIALDIQSVLAVEAELDVPIDAISVLPEGGPPPAAAPPSAADREARWRKARALYLAYVDAQELLEEGRPAAIGPLRSPAPAPPGEPRPAAEPASDSAVAEPADSADRARFDFFVISPAAREEDAAALAAADAAPGCRPTRWWPANLGRQAPGP